MKKCTTCQETLAVSAFNKNKAKSDGLSTVCRECMKVFRRRHYEANYDKVYAEVKSRRQMLLNKVWEYKLSHPCVDCGYSNPKALDFDHLSDKSFNIATMAGQGRSWPSILDEIAKCEVVCSNCHRIRTFDRAGWVRY